MRYLAAIWIALALVIAVPIQAMAQQRTTFIQIEAVPSLEQATTRARAYSGAFPNVSGFALRNGWFAIALGPYVTSVAVAELDVLKRERLIPIDSYITRAGDYRRQIWPTSGETRQPAPDPQPAPQTTVVAPPPPPVIDETPRQARQSEALLTEVERKFLQEALQWEGFYRSAIDGAFGRGTRASMAAWQRAQGLEPTGILTTRQRDQLMDSYRAVFAPFGLAPVRNEAAGIEIELPLGKVAYARTEAPFVQYDPTDDSGMRVMLISQTGDEATLFGLYDIMQTLEIVPEEGARQRRRRDFVLTGQSAEVNSHTYARLEGGAVKGYSLIWKPGGDPRIMERVLKTMERSFRPISGAILPDTAVSGDGRDQRVDLLAGLEIRRPERTQTGFFVDAAGAVLTSSEAVAQCGRLTLGAATEASVLAADADLGLAVLRPADSLAPLAVAAFQGRLPRLKSEIAVAGFSYGDVMDLPVLTFGTLADVRGLAGEADVQRLDLTVLPGDVGGPVFDQTGAVVGMLKARGGAGAQRLPEAVNFAVGVPAIATFLENAGIAAQPAEAGSALAPEDISRLASDVAVQVNCWN